MGQSKYGDVSQGGLRGVGPHLGVGWIEDHEELGDRPVEPAHEENARGQAVRYKYQARVLAEAPRVYVPDHVILHTQQCMRSQLLHQPPQH